jgi:hypothetical protein
LEAFARRLAVELGTSPERLLGGNAGVRVIEGDVVEEASP